MTVSIREATTVDDDDIADLYVAPRADALGHLQRIRNEDEHRAFAAL